MNVALAASATGMAAQQQNLDTIADNLANADVAGFKANVQRFAELSAPGGPGVGTIALGARVQLSQGKLEKSNGPFDVAIDGPGFLCVIDDAGKRWYTRDGRFERAADSTLRNAAGMRLDGVRVPAGALSLSVAQDGRVTASLQHGSSDVGRIRIAEFAAPERLQCAGGTLFAATPQSGAARYADAGSGNAPKVRFGMLERSNVTIVEAMMQILSSQRAYEANAKGVQAADEMLRIANNLQRG
jgi:flagellar basal-body rod protein FlgG